MDLHVIRQDYAKESLELNDCAELPLTQLKTWLEAALHAKVNEPTAMNVAAVDANGRPNARIVLLKELSDDGLVFFTNYDSRKGQALQAHPFAAVTFFWPELERQVRVEGKVVKLDEAASDEYFASRPYASRIGAWASEQSQVIPNKTHLMKRATAIGLKHPLNVPRPPHWGGFVVIPDCVEFWQGRPSRLHDRVQYRLQDDGAWEKVRLAP